MAKQKKPHDNEKASKAKIDIEINDEPMAVNQDGQDTKNTAKRDQAAEKETDKAPSHEDIIAAEKDKYLRLAAEYDNFRKRTAKERDSIYSNSKADVIAKLLPVYDNLERAIKTECTDEAYSKGIEMIMLQLTEILKDIGVEPIPTVGEPFDANFHDAVMRIENKDLGDGIIAEECQKGFTIGERIIRHSKVVVAN